MKYCEIIADRLSKAGWSWGYVSAIDEVGRSIWIVDAHREDGKRYVARADDLLTASFNFNPRCLISHRDIGKQLMRISENGLEGAVASRARTKRDQQF